MSYPPDPNNPYGQPQQPAQPGYGYPQQPPAQPQYGYPQQPPAGAPQDAYGQQAAYGYPQQPPAAAPGYGYPADPYGNAGYVQNAYASWGSRVAAYIVDAIIIGLVPGILYGIGIAMAASTITYTTDPATGVQIPQSSGGSAFGIIFILLGALLALGLGLWLCYQEGTTGQTPGKKMVNIRLVREIDGQPLGFGMAVVRKICHVLDGFVCYLGFLWPLWDAKKQTFADKVMNTVVVKAQ
ncbi:RDD family protein [Streptacidiphilus sp. EB129]|jgi:uncharacterized RDD family membrane protein YckC|uniref:RDD family protein n=1 Tax=Streptacidiphilus sp. EB129 TaxID=3156262 RepID=UPI0035196F40